MNYTGGLLSLSFFSYLLIPSFCSFLPSLSSLSTSLFHLPSFIHSFNKHFQSTAGTSGGVWEEGEIRSLPLECAGKISRGESRDAPISSFFSPSPQSLCRCRIVSAFNPVSQFWPQRLSQHQPLIDPTYKLRGTAKKKRRSKMKQMNNFVLFWHNPTERNCLRWL